MLKRLHVSGVGTIGDAVMEPGSGMTAITGETGAGKSMLLEALAMIGGGRSRRGVGDGSCAEGAFSTEDGETRLVRDTKGGRGSRTINGHPAKVKDMKDAARRLFIIHGQSDQLRLADPVEQLRLLDSYADDGALADSWAVAHREADRVRAIVAKADDPELLDRIEFLESGLGRIGKVGLQPGELARLRAKADELDEMNARRERTMRAMDDLDDARSLLSSAAETMGGDDTLRGMVETLGDIMLTAGGPDDDEDGPEDVNAINGRIADIENAIRRHGGDEETAIAWMEHASAELEDLKGVLGSCDQARGMLRDVEAAERDAGRALTDARTAAAGTMGTAINRELAGLSMPGASVCITVEHADPSPTGMDSVSFLFSPYSGAEPEPMGMAASGGELSRLMLAIELVSADARHDDGATPTMVFDEVDAGVGGRAAMALGLRLARLAASTQVIVVTHLAQVAAHADVQYAVSRTDGSTTVSRVGGTDRVREIARMMGDDDAPGMAHAKAMLERCGRRGDVKGDGS